MNKSPYSQYDQDIWVLNQLNQKLNGYFVEVGAFQQADGYMSNTLFLEERYNWNGILIEPNKKTFKNLCNRKSIKLNVAASDHDGDLNFRHGNRGCDSMVSSVGEKTPCLTLNTILKENNASAIIDFLSIDVEGHEETVLKGVDFSSYHVNCAVIEYAFSNLDVLKKTMFNAGFDLIEQTQFDLFFKNKLIK